jgi:hypothetical protein
MKMIIVTEKKSPIKETDGKTVTSFDVNYWGVKVTYGLHQAPSGAIYYRAENNDDRKAAKILAEKAEDLFITAQKKAGINPAFHVGGKIAEGLIPIETIPR